MYNVCEPNTNIVILVGNGANVNRRDIIQGVEKCMNLGARKVMLCAFPYSKNYSDIQNNKIHSLNTIMFNLTCRHSDKLLYFDCNKFINNFKLTEKVVFLPKIYRQKIATLVAYNINLVTNVTNNYTTDSPTLCINFNTGVNNLN